MSEKDESKEIKEAEAVEEAGKPVLDGAEDHTPKDVDPRKGLDDPALIRHPEDPDPTANPYG